MKLNKLSKKEKEVIIDKATEKPHTGKYNNFYKDGYYICKQCEQPLFDSKAKFDAGCGWPSFDKFFTNSVNETIDVDGRRIEITCSRCGGHLGHVFRGERLTPIDTRYCVNSLSIKFVPRKI